MLNKEQLDNFKPFLPERETTHNVFIPPVPRKKVAPKNFVVLPNSTERESVADIQARWGVKNK